jgi:hypothetical protein
VGSQAVGTHRGLAMPIAASTTQQNHEKTVVGHFNKTSEPFQTTDR